MSKLRVHFEPYAAEAGQAVVPLEVLDSNLRRLDGRLHRLKLNEALEVDVEPGTFLVQAYLPSGEVVANQVEVRAGQTSDVPLAPQRMSPREELAWGYYLKSPTRGSRGEMKAMGDMSLFLKGKPHLTLWECRRNAQWEVTDANLVSNEDPTGDLRSLGRLKVAVWSRAAWLYVSWAVGKGKFVALPPAPSVGIQLFADEIPGADDDPINVLIDGGNPRTEALLGYLMRGEGSAARLIGEDFEQEAEQLLRAKVSDPSSAAVGGYFLLLAGQHARLHDWTRNLDNWFELFPDGAVIHAWHRLAQSPPDFDLARERLVEATKRGLPVYTRGLRLLFDGLSMLSGYYREKLGGRDDRQIAEALDRLRPYAAAADWGATTTTFYGVDPRRPGKD